MFGSERLHELLAVSPALSAEELAARVETAVLEFTGRRITDDTAVLALHLPAAP